MKKLIIALAAVTMLGGCAQRVADLTIASTKNIDINKSTYVKGMRVSGEDQKAIILVPLGTPNVKEAADKAIEQDKCAVGLTDVTADYTFIHMLVLPFGTNWYTVEGDQIIDTSIPGCENWINE